MANQPSKLCIAAAGVILWGELAFAAGAPPQLYNKTIHLTWVQDSVERTSSGQVIRPRIEHQRTIYVSTIGRLFARRTFGNAYRSKSAELGPGDNRRPQDGLAMDWHFEGRRLVGSKEHFSGAGRAIVDFDAAYGSCTLAVIYGKSNGAPIRWRALDGDIHEVMSVAASSPTCTVRDGNEFAGQ